MLEELRRALRMDYPSSRLSETNLKKLSRGLRPSKQSRLSLASKMETQSVQDDKLGTRSISLSTLLPSGGASDSGIRTNKLQSLEAKMASIEMSLGWRRRREALLETLPRAARDLIKELDMLHQTVKEKDIHIQGLKSQITSLGGTVSGTKEVNVNRAIGEAEKNSIHDRLDKLKKEINAKNAAIKNLKLALEKIDITNNTDVRLQATELEYELERDEQNLVNLKQESTLLTNRLQVPLIPLPFPEASMACHSKARISFQEALSVPGNASIFASVSLVVANVSYTPGNPPFHITFRPPHGCVIDWATDDTRLKKGDSIIEINHEFVLGESIEDITNFMSQSSHLSLVVTRPMGNSICFQKHNKQLEEKVKETKDLISRLDKALKERDSFSNDNTRLNHRISYLEDQVNELQITLQKAKESAIITGSPNEVLTPSQPGATIIQVFQKGPQTMAVAETDLEKSENRIQEYPTLPRLKSPSCSSQDSGPIYQRIITDTFKTTKKFSPVSDINSTHEMNKTISSMSTSSSVNQFSLTTNYENEEHDIYKAVKVMSNQDFNANGKKKSDVEYDYIDHLRDKLSEKIPSYSYKLSDGIKYERNAAITNFEKESFDLSQQECTKNEVSSVSESPEKIEFNRHHTMEDSAKVERDGERWTSRRQVSHNSEDGRRNKSKPIPPKKPERLSLQRASSVQSVEDTRPCSRTSSASTSRGFYYKNKYPSSDNILNNRIHLDPSGHPEHSADKIDLEHGDRILPNTDECAIVYSQRQIPHMKDSNKSNNISKNTSSQIFRDSRRLTVSSIEYVPIYGKIKQNNCQITRPVYHSTSSELSNTSSPQNGYHQSGKSLASSPSRDKQNLCLSSMLDLLSKSLHHNSSISMTSQHKIKPQPIYEYLESPDNISKKFSASRSSERPYKESNLRISNAVRNGNKWC